MSVENKKYSILITAFDCHYSHIERFVKLLKYTNPLVEITLFANRYDISDVIKENVDGIVYRDAGVNKTFRQFKRLSLILNKLVLFRQVKNMSQNFHYDIVNIHFPVYYWCFIMRCFKKMSTAVVVSPWGSDVLRLRGKGKRKCLARVFRQSDFITVGQSGDIGKVLVNEMGVRVNQFHPLAWGSETIDYINEHLSEMSVDEAKSKLGLGGYYIITCGYNAFEAQRHEVMIKAIKTIKQYLPDNLMLLFPVTYGESTGTRKDEYVGRLKGLCEELKLKAVFYEDYLSVAELFYLRLATDMFIHIQTTDGGNSSLQEYVLCGKKVVHGTWIHYPHLEQYKPLFYYPVGSLDALGETIIKAYHSDPIKTPPEVMEYVKNRGWKAKMKLWNEFFCTISK